MPKVYISNPRKIKELSSLAQRCFEKIVGEPPNHNFKFHTPEEIEYTFDILSTMVRGYLKEITQEEFDFRRKQDAERAAERKAADVERNLKAQETDDQSQHPIFTLREDVVKTIEDELGELAKDRLVDEVINEMIGEHMTVEKEDDDNEQPS